MPTAIIELSVPITFMATAPDSAMLAGIDRSTLPGPVVMTNIWPMPTSTKKVEKESAATSMSPAPWPPEWMIAASQTAKAPTKDQIHAFSRRVRGEKSLAPYISLPSG